MEVICASGEEKLRILGAFVKLRKEAISFVTAVRLPIRPIARNSSSSTGGSLVKSEF